MLIIPSSYSKSNSPPAILKTYDLFLEIIPGNNLDKKIVKHIILQG